MINSVCCRSFHGKKVFGSFHRIANKNLLIIGAFKTVSMIFSDGDWGGISTQFFKLNPSTNINISSCYHADFDYQIFHFNSISKLQFIGR